MLVESSERERGVDVRAPSEMACLVGSGDNFGCYSTLSETGSLRGFHKEEQCESTLV